MVKLNKIYTRSGDDGTTGLVDGSRVSKGADHMEAIGDVDEANATIGLACAAIPHGESRAMLLRIQQDLFDLGADFATPLNADLPGEPLRITQSQVQRIEQEIDMMNASLTPLNSFILPGGSDVAARLHLARTIVRRAERAACRFAEQAEVNHEALHYLNRLSDHLFVMARAHNNGGAADVLWEPGVNR